MLEYILGCLTVGVVWYLWPKIGTWVAGEKAMVIQDVKSEEDKRKEKF